MTQETISPSVTGPLSEYVALAARTELPDNIRTLAREHLLDTVAAIVACRDLPAARVARRYALSQTGVKDGGVRILGTSWRASLSDAVFASAIAGHAAEINDFCPSAYVQPGPAVVSATLSVAEQRGASGEATLRALVAGYEMACRTPKALGLRNLRRAGIANHGVGPVFGTAAAVACLIGLTATQIASVWSYCAQQASGSWQWLLDVDHVEKAFVFAGIGARNGLQSALLVEAGFTGIPDALDVAGGWLDSATFNGPQSDLNRRYWIEDLGRRFELPLVGFKRFPVGGPCQPAIQGLLELIQQVDRRHVTGVRIEMPDRPQTFATAAMPALNLPYLSSIILLDGELDFVAAQSRERLAADDAAHRLMSRVQVMYDPGQDRSPRVESARVTVELRTGESKSVFVEHVPGFPARPLSHAQVVDKARELLRPHLGKRGAERVIDLVENIEMLPSVTPLIDAVAVDDRQ